MNTFRADLHCHTTCSDGSLTPEQIVTLAKEIGLSALSITDHDTVDAYTTALPLSEKLGLVLLPGVEFSAVWEQESVHILGYGFTLQDPSIQTFCDAHAKRRLDRNMAILEKLAKNRMPLSYEEVLVAASSPSEERKKKTIGRPHIALALMAKGYVKSIQEAFRYHIGEGCPCYDQGSFFCVVETIELLHNANGIAIIAHPHLIREETVLAALLKLNFDGIECYYSNQSPKNNERWIKIAQTKQWLMTGGSDFHGISRRPDDRLGSSWVNEEIFNKLLACLKK
jgi:predicted metal-dependent phosphoesterase TrpH